MMGGFITVEGLDGAGKSSVLPVIAKTLRDHGHEVVLTREPGGTAVGEQLRAILLREPMCPRTEALIVFAARQEHLTRVILPALDAGHWVVCDRFTDATMAYQGAGRGVEAAALEELERWVQHGFGPVLTLLLDLPTPVAKERSGAARDPDRIEAEHGEFFTRVREGYLARARAAPRRMRVIDGNQSREAVAVEVKRVLEEFLRDRPSTS